MNWFPTSTVVDHVIPKDAFYKQLTLSAELKDKFVTDVKRITLSNSLTVTTLNLEMGQEVSEILVLTVDLKKQKFDRRIIENIARQNTHKLVFFLRYEEKVQLAVYYGKLYTTEWKLFDDLQLALKGFTLDDVWNGILEQIILWNEIAVDCINDDIDTRLRRQDTILKLQKGIERLEKLTRGEQQPKKKFELYQKLQDKKKKLRNFYDLG